MVAHNLECPRLREATAAAADAERKRRARHVIMSTFKLSLQAGVVDALRGAVHFSRQSH